MTKTSTRFAIVGHGSIAQVHANALRAIPEAQLVAVVGRNSLRAEPFAREHRINTFSEVETAIRTLGVDAVVVATPHPTHAEIATAAAAAGAHVLVEKPLASSVSECDQILKAAVAAGTIVGVVSQRRLLAPVRRMKSAIDRGAIGKPILATVNLFGWRSPRYYESGAWRGTWSGEGGGVLINQAVHHLDLLQWMVGPFEEVFGYWANLNHPDIEIEDTAVAVLRGQDGRLASIVASNSQNPGLYARILVHGHSGASVGAQTDGGSMFIAGSSEMQDAPYNHVWTIPGDEPLLEDWRRQDAAEFRSSDPILRYHELVIRDFIAAVRSGSPTAVPGYEGRNTVELFEAIYRSNEQGARVQLNPMAEPT